MEGAGVVEQIGERGHRVAAGRSCRLGDGRAAPTRSMPSFRRQAGPCPRRSRDSNGRRAHAAGHDRALSDPLDLSAEGGRHGSGPCRGRWSGLADHPTCQGRRRASHRHGIHRGKGEACPATPEPTKSSSTLSRTSKPRPAASPATRRRRRYDSVGATTFEKSLQFPSSPRHDGPVRTVERPCSALRSGILAQKGSLYLTRPTLAHYMLTREELSGELTNCSRPS